MRRERVDTLQNSGLDPSRAGRAVRRRSPHCADEPPARDDELILPGAPEDPPARNLRTTPGKNPSPNPAAGAPAAPAADRGVRPGCAAVRQGYGAALPKAISNAGRPRDPQPSLNAPGAPGNAAAAAGPPAAASTAGPGTAAEPFPQGSSQPTAEDFGR